MYCVKCGEQLPDNARFCVNCGTAAVGVDAHSSNAQPTIAPIVPAGAQDSNRPNKLKMAPMTIAAIAAVAVAVIVVIVVIAVLVGPSAQGGSQSGASGVTSAASSQATTTSSSASAAVVGQQPKSTGSSSSRSGDYILPDSSTKSYSRSELAAMDLYDLYLARNEIYARYGRGFKNSDLQNYFNSKSWYKQRYTPEQFESMASPLNDTERHNAELMLQVEQERNSPYLN